jgi:serine/threonine protein kinase
MRLQRQFTGQPVTLDPSTIIGSGGEGKIYGVREEPNWVAKIYHHPTDEDAEKLTVMYNNPPTTVMAMPGGTSIAWPVDLLHTLDNRRQIVGFLMPRVRQAAPIHTFYTPKTRREQKPLFNYLYLHRTARNLVAAIGDLHASGYVVGDVNESNILVTDTALVMLVDTDSFQVRDLSTGRIYRCPVGKAEFTPPELQGQSFRDLDRTSQQDRFGLAVLIFQLLMEGTHPFSGVYKGSGDPPAIEARIRAGHFVYGSQSVPYKPMPFAPPYNLLHPHLQQLFIRCFEEGYNNPNARPDAKTWFNALKLAESELITCSKYSQHRYGNHLSSCPWCDRTVKLGGRDPFPSRQAVEQGEHLQPLKRKKRRRVVAASPLSPNRGIARSTVYRPVPQPQKKKVYRRSKLIPSLPTHLQLLLWQWIKGMVLGGVWGVICTSAVVAIIFGIFLGTSGILGGMFVGMIWGGFFGATFNLFMPPHRKLAQLMSLLWGGICGGFLAAAIAGILYGVLANVEAIGQGIVVGGVLGGLWGGLWHSFKPPLSLPTSARLRGFTGAVLGSIWGAFLGTVVGLVLAIIAVSWRELQLQNTISADLVSEILGIIIIASGLGAVGGVLSGIVIGAIGGVPPLPNALQLSGRRGALVGSIWGNFLGVITGSVLGGLASPFLDQLLQTGTTTQNTPVVIGVMIATAGMGAIWGSFSGIVWGAFGRF